MSDIDIQLMRAAIGVARRARVRGNHPFGAILVDDRHQVLLEAENTVVTDRDLTGHAETNLVRLATRRYTQRFLATCSIYTSTEPCPMCSGAIFWSNVRRVVYGLGQEGLYELIGEGSGGPKLHVPCRDIFDRGRPRVAVVGPVLAAEAREVHLGFWSSHGAEVGSPEEDV